MLTELLKILEQGSSFQRAQAVEAIGQMGAAADIAVPKLIALLETADSDLTYLIADALQNISTAEALFALHDKVMPKFIQQYDQVDREQQEDILISLAEFGELAEPAKDKLIQILESETLEFAILAASALRAIGEKDGLKKVDAFIESNISALKQLLQSKDPEQRNFAMFACRKLGLE